MYLGLRAGMLGMKVVAFKPGAIPESPLRGRV